jgi:hypothetical protein
VNSELPAFGQLLHLAILGVDILLASNHYRSLFTALELTVSAAAARSVNRQREERTLATSFEALSRRADAAARA